MQFVVFQNSLVNARYTSTYKHMIMVYTWCEVRVEGLSSN